MMDTSGIQIRLERIIQTLLEVRGGDQASLSRFQKDLGFPINFQEVSGLVTFEALKSAWLSRFQEM